MSRPADTATVARVARGGLWSILAYAGEGGSLFAVSVILARSLGPGGFGEYSFYLWVFRMLPTLLALGIPAALAKMVPEALGAGDGGKAHGFFRAARRFHRGALAVPVAIAAWILAADGEPGLAALLVVGTAASLAVLDLEGLLTGLRDFRVLGAFAFASGALQVAAALAGFALGATWQGFLALLVAAGIAGLTGLSLVCRRRLRALPPPALSAADRAAFVRFAAISSATLLVDAVLWGRPELLFLRWTGDTAGTGFYSAALRVAGLVAVLPLLASRALLPELARLRGAGDEAGVAALYARTSELLALLAAPLAALGAALAPVAVTLLYGPGFAPAGAPTAILVGGAFVNGIAGATSAAVLTGPRPRLAAQLGALAAAVNVALDAVLIPRHGAIGAATATLAVQGGSVVVGIVYAWRWLGYAYPLARVARIVAVAAAAGVCAAGASHAVGGGAAGLVAGATAGTALYALAGLAVRAIDPEGIREIAARGAVA